jgi:hypothetical protein
MNGAIRLTGKSRASGLPAARSLYEQVVKGAREKPELLEALLFIE